MTPILLALTLALVQQQQPPADTGEAGRLRRQIEDRFAQHVQQQLRLSPDQATKLRATQERFGERRRSLMRQQVDRRMALNDQLQFLERVSEMRQERRERRGGPGGPGMRPPGGRRPRRGSI